MEELCKGEHGPVVVNSNPVVGTDCVLDRVLYLEMEWSNDHGVVFIPITSHISELRRP